MMTAIPKLTEEWQEKLCSNLSREQLPTVTSHPNCYEKAPKTEMHLADNASGNYTTPIASKEPRPTLF